jgi:diketogulonate reductase-like aldo/keto reductase
MLNFLALRSVLGSDVPTVPNVTLNNGVQMPIIALGTAQMDNDTVAAVVEMAIGNGFPMVHSAYDYFNLEGVGRGVAAARAKGQSVFVAGMTSPCFHPAAPPQRNVSDPAACEALTRRELSEVLSKLNVSSVDLMMLHGPSAAFGTEAPCSDFACALNAAQWRAYTELLHRGGARAIGVSNFCESCLRCLPGLVPAVNQLQQHVGTGADPEGLMSYCASQGVVVQAYSPLAAGKVPKDPLCAEVAAAYNKTAAQAGLRWVLQQPTAPTLVTKADTVQYVAQDLDVLSWRLTVADMARLDAATVPKGQQEGRPSWGCAAR